MSPTNPNVAASVRARLLNVAKTQGVAGIWHFLASVAETFRDIAAVAVDDGIAFDPASVTVKEIRKEAGYGGVRVIIVGNLAKARCKTQIDVGFGDAGFETPHDRVVCRMYR